MIISYRDRKAERFAAGDHVREFSGFARQAEMRLDRLDAARSLADLRALPGNRLEALRGDRAGPIQHSLERPMAGLLRVAERGKRTDQCRDR